MNRALSIGAFVLSAIALGTVLFADDDQPPAPVIAPQPEERSPTPEVDMTERDAKISALEWTVSNLVRRVTALEKSMAERPVEGSAAAVTATERQQLQSLRSDVDALLTGEVLDTDEGRTRLKEMVRTIQDEAFADRIQQRTAQREASQAERLQSFAKEARLSSTQEADVKRILDAEAQERHALFEQMRSGQAAGERPDRSQMRELRERTEQQLRSVLDEEQMRQYEQTLRDGGRDRRGGRAERGDRGARGQRQ